MNTFDASQCLDSQITTSSCSEMWIAEAVQFLAALGMRTVPVFDSGKTLPFADGQNYPYGSGGRYQRVRCVAGVLDDFILVDWDGYKESSISLDELRSAMGLQQLPPAFQRNPEGNSIHFLFKRPAKSLDLKCSNDGWLPGVDIKTGNQLIHIKPTKFIDPAYKDFALEFLEAPQNLLSALLARPSGTLSTVVLDGRPDELDEIRELLRFLDPDMEYRGWLNVLLGIYALFGNTPHAIELADDWSRDGQKYTGRAEIAGKFNSFKLGGGISERTLFWMAGQAGADLSKFSIVNRSVLDEFDDLTERCDQWPTINLENYTRELPRRWVFVSEQNMYFDLVSHSLVTAAALNTQYAHISCFDANGKLKPIRASVIIGSSHDKKVVNCIGWHPTDADVFEHGGKQVINTYRGPQLKPVQGKPQMWLDLMRHIFGEYADLVIGHMAFTVQRPDEKIRWQVLTVSEHKRTGKSSTAAPLKQIFSEEHQVVSAVDLDTGWGDFEFGKKVIIIEELLQPGKGKKFFNAIKAGLVNSDLEMMNLKGRGISRQQNVRSYYLFTNHYNAVSFDNDEDKLLVIEAPATPWQGDFRAYHEAIEKGDLAAQVYNYLLEFDISDFPYDKLPVRTPALRRLCSESSADYQQWMEERAEMRMEPFDGPVVKFDFVRRALRDNGYLRAGHSGIAERLRDSGFKKVTGRKSISGSRKKCSCWIPIELAKLVTEAEIYDLYQISKCGSFGLSQRNELVSLLSEPVIKWLLGADFQDFLGWTDEVDDEWDDDIPF